MDKKSKIFFTVFFLVALGAAGVSFFKFIIRKDYYIRVEVPCDSSKEKCFINEGEGTDVSYYKLVEKKAYAIPLCDPAGSDCPPLSCQPGEDCREIFCDQTTKSQDQTCSNLETP